MDLTNNISDRMHNTITHCCILYNMVKINNVVPGFQGWIIDTVAGGGHPLVVGHLSNKVCLDRYCESVLITFDMQPALLA